jgi:galactokinase/mevalonate kinase-like predicted kinase
VFGAVAARLERTLPPHETAEAIRSIEYEIMGVVCGFQDQYMAVFGGLNYLDFRDKGSHLPPNDQPLATVEPLAARVSGSLPFCSPYWREASFGQRSQERARAVAGRRPGRAKRLRAYSEFGPLGEGRALAHDWERLADAMNENQKIQHDLGASGKACDDLIAVAHANGAVAGNWPGPGTAARSSRLPSTRSARRTP